jgi:hypothetical protein
LRPRAIECVCVCARACTHARLVMEVSTVER